MVRSKSPFRKNEPLFESIICKALAGDARAAEIALQRARANEPPEPRRKFIVRFAGDPVDENEGEGHSQEEHQ
jgi:hypothetical protein